MKRNVIESIVIMFVIVFGLGAVGYVDTHGTVYGEVTEVSDGLVIFNAGDSVWSFYGDGFETGDRIKVTIDDHGTFTTTDDKVVKAKKVESR